MKFAHFLSNLAGAFKENKITVQNVVTADKKA